MIKVSHLSKHFNSDILTRPIIALDDLSFDIEPGKVTGFLGANGAGKTTCIKIIMDFIRPTSGSVNFHESMGQDKNTIFSNLGYLPERPYFYPHLTGREFCHYLSSMCDLKKNEIESQIEKWSDVFKITFALDRPLKGYSKGMLQRVGFLATLIHEPKFIVLDEPLAGLDPVGRKELRDVITMVGNEGKTIFFSSHIVSDLEEVSDNVVIIKDGKHFYDGAIDQLIKDYSDNSSTIKFVRDKKIDLLEVSSEKKEIELKRLIQDGCQIQAVLPNNPTLEDIVYKVKQ